LYALPPLVLADAGGMKEHDKSYKADDLGVGHGEPDVGGGPPCVGRQDARPVEGVGRVVNL
jgi:hypothetical protein